MRTISARVDDELQAQVQRLSNATERNPSWHIERAVRAYLRQELWQIEETRSRLVEAERGEGMASRERVRQLFARSGVDIDAH